MQIFFLCVIFSAFFPRPFLTCVCRDRRPGIVEYRIAVEYHHVHAQNRNRSYSKQRNFNLKLKQFCIVEYRFTVDTTCVHTQNILEIMRHFNLKLRRLNSIIKIYSRYYHVHAQKRNRVYSRNYETFQFRIKEIFKRKIQNCSRISSRSCLEQKHSRNYETF